MANRRYIIPATSVIAVLIIAAAAYATFSDRISLGLTETKKTSTVHIRPVDARDHILGNPNAKVILVEYSDFECPFCKGHHEVMKKIMDEFGKNGDVAWVFRHFPLVEIHSKAPTEALATECAAQQGGNPAFWAMANKIYETTPGNNLFDLATLPVLAKDIGLSVPEFETCMRSGDLMERVNRDFDDAKQAGARGTPFTVLIAGGKEIPMHGAQQYPALRAIVTLAVKQAGANQGSYTSPSEGAEPYPGSFLPPANEQKNGVQSGTTSTSTRP